MLSLCRCQSSPKCVQAILELNRGTYAYIRCRVKRHGNRFFISIFRRIFPTRLHLSKTDVYKTLFNNKTPAALPLQGFLFSKSTDLRQRQIRKSGECRLKLTNIESISVTNTKPSCCFGIDCVVSHFPCICFKHSTLTQSVIYADCCNIFVCCQFVIFAS